MDLDKASKDVGVGIKTGERDFQTGNVHNVHLSDKRLKVAGIDPKSLLGHGITEEELLRRLAEKKKRVPSGSGGGPKKG